MNTQTADQKHTLQTRANGSTFINVDGREFAAHEEDGLLIVQGESDGLSTLPTPRDGFVVRVNASAELEIHSAQ